MRVVLADDHKLMLAAVRRALEDAEGFEVVAETYDGGEVLDVLARTRADIVMLDVRMPNVDGLTCLGQIKERHPDTKVVMLSASTAPDLVDEAFRKGASAYLAKSIDPDELPDALRRVSAGEVLNLSQPDGVPDRAVGGPGLTERETEVLSAVARGLSNDQIAKEMWVTPQTVKFHLANVYRKLGARNRTEATLIGYQRGLIERPLIGD